VDRLSNELISKIEQALDISFYEWQRKYLMEEPMILDMRMTGRRTGKTLVFIVKKLFESTEPLLLRDRKETLCASDWWCCETRIDRAMTHPYLDWYRHELREIHKKLADAGITTREVIF